MKQYPIICPSCKGAKMIDNPDPMAFPLMTTQTRINCPACKGTGTVICTDFTQNTTTTQASMPYK
jgi:DnaJ-class molecular chaperone